MDTTALHDAYRTLLAAAATVADSDRPLRAPEGEWNVEQVLGHIALVDAGTIAAAAAVASGANTTYDNRSWIDTWTIQRVIARAGGAAAFRERIGHQGEALCTLAGQVLSAGELDTPVPTLLIASGRMGSAGALEDNVLVDQPVPLRALISGLADDHLPSHTRQLLALLPDAAPAAAMG